MKSLHFLIKNIMCTSTALCILSPAYAETSNSNEVEELRKEVEALKASLQQYVINNEKKTVHINSQSNPSEISFPSKNNILKSGAEVNLYGFVRLDGTYQSAGSDGMFNNINSVPLKNTKEAGQQEDRLKSTASVTRIGMDFKTPLEMGDVGGKIEMDFVGGAARDQFRIRHAYLTYDKWLIGQAWSTFVSPVEFMPEPIDALGYVGGALLRTPLIRYSDRLSSNMNYAVSIEDQKYMGQNEPENKVRLPAVVARINYQFAEGEGLVSGRTFVAEKKTSEDKNVAWGLGIGTKYQITPKTLLRGDYYHVKGDGRYVLWSNNGYVIDGNKKMHSNEFDSITLGLTHKFNPKLRSTIGYGYMLAKDDNDFARLNYNNTTQNKSLWQGWVNVMYNPYNPITLGVEYLYGERKTFNDEKGEDNRINIMASYIF